MAQLTPAARVVLSAQSRFADKLRDVGGTKDKVRDVKNGAKHKIEERTDKTVDKLRAIFTA